MSADPPGGEPDLQSSLPGFSRPLSVQSSQNSQDELLGSLHIAWPGQARAYAHLAGVNLGGYGDPTEHPRKESYWGHANPVGIRTCYDEGKRISETRKHARSAMCPT
jgi:hypothetical protein